MREICIEQSRNGLKNAWIKDHREFVNRVPKRFDAFTDTKSKKSMMSSLNKSVTFRCDAAKSTPYGSSLVCSVDTCNVVCYSIAYARASAKRCSFLTLCFIYDTFILL